MKKAKEKKEQEKKEALERAENEERALVMSREEAKSIRKKVAESEKLVQQKMEEGYNVLLEIDTQGSLQVKEKMPEAVLIFIAPPSVEELEHRLRGRHTEDEETIQKRLAQVKIELERSKKYDYIVINENIEHAVEEIEGIVKSYA